MVEGRHSSQIGLVFMQDEGVAAFFSAIFKISSPGLEDTFVQECIFIFYVVKSHFLGHLAVCDYSCRHRYTSWGFHIEQLLGLSPYSGGKSESVLQKALSANARFVLEIVTDSICQLMDEKCLDYREPFQSWLSPLLTLCL